MAEERGDDYNYKKHYYGNPNIFYSFRIGNTSHTYNREYLDVINKILTEKNAREFWLPTVARLTIDGAHHLSVVNAIDNAFKDIRLFMEENRERLNIKEDRLQRRMQDLEAYMSSKFC